MKEINIFYSWQSDLPTKTNKVAIRDILKKVKSKIEQEYSGSINIKIDEATNEEIGSPDISQTIIEKISKCDVFIGDISIINNESEDVRKTPNPNVMFELGFAASRLGWERVILLFNKALGDIKDLPFDIQNRRVSPYKVKKELNDEQIKSIIGNYVDDLYNFIKAILDTDPKKPVREVALNPEEIKRNKDIEHIIEFLQCMQIEIIDKHKQNIPQYVYDDIWYFYNRLEGIAHSSRFNLYNRELYNYMVEFWTAWTETLNHSECYNPTPNGTRYTWDNPLDMPLTPDRQTKWDTILNARGEMNASLTNILRIIRDDYLEIDIDRISQKNLNEYIEYEGQNP